jgi:alpha-D-ribose 1-methylphosphonate 5-phosphate C-P lyase
MRLNGWQRIGIVASAIWALALTAMVASPTAQAADTTLTLACQGTTTDKMKEAKDAKPAPISMGIIVNFTKNTVQGFGIPGVSDYPVKIRGMNDARIVFDGAHDDGTSAASITGSIDRVTGDVEATDILYWRALLVIRERAPEMQQR